MLTRVEVLCYLWCAALGFFGSVLGAVDPVGSDSWLMPIAMVFGWMAYKERAAC